MPSQQDGRAVGPASEKESSPSEKCRRLKSISVEVNTDVEDIPRMLLLPSTMCAGLKQCASIRLNVRGPSDGSLTERSNDSPASPLHTPASVLELFGESFVLNACESSSTRPPERPANLQANRAPSSWFTGSHTSEPARLHWTKGDWQAWEGGKDPGGDEGSRTRASVNSAPIDARCFQWSSFDSLDCGARKAVKFYSDSSDEEVVVERRRRHRRRRPQHHRRQQQHASQTGGVKAPPLVPTVLDTEAGSTLPKYLLEASNLQSSPIEVVDDVSIEGFVTLSPWLLPYNGKGASSEDRRLLASESSAACRGKAVCSRTSEWARETARLITFSCSEEVNDDLCFMLMRAGEEKLSRKSQFQRAYLPEVNKHYSGVQTETGCAALADSAKRRLKRSAKHSRFLSFCSRASSQQPCLEVLRLQPHGTAVLGETAWQKLLDGIRVWAFLGISTASIAKIDLHLFYLEKNTGNFKLAKVGGGGAVGTQSLKTINPAASGTTAARLVYGGATADCRIPSFGKRESIMTGLRASKNFPLEYLIEIDRGPMIHAAVNKDSHLRRTPLGHKLKYVAALWSTNSQEPLICASETQSEVDTLVSVIRFLQFYTGVCPADVVERPINQDRTQSSIGGV